MLGANHSLRVIGVGFQLYGQLKKSPHDSTGVLGSTAVSMASQATRLGKGSSVTARDERVERVQKGIAHWDKQNHAVPAPNCMLKVQGEIIKVEGL